MSTLTSNLKANAPVEPAGESVLGQAFDTGLRNAGAGLTALGGTALDAMGMQTPAKALYDTSAGLRAAAQAGAPEINSIRQVHNLDTAARYGVGLVGQAVPMLGAGLAGAVLSRNPLVGASLATAPLMAGDVAARQQEDPTIAATPAARRLTEAAGTGVVGATLANAVPVAMGGKILGRGLSEAGMGLGQNVASNVAEAVGGNAAAGALGEHMTQQSLSNLNPNRDTSGDQQAMLDAAAGGAAMGLPFAAAGVAGEATRGKGAAPRTDGVPIEPAARGGEPATGAAPAPEPAPTPAGPSLVDRIKGAFTPDENGAALDAVAKGRDMVDVDALLKATPQEQERMLNEADTSRLDKVKAWASKLYEDASLTPEARAKIDDFMANPADRAKQAAVAGVEQARAMGEKATTAAKDFYDSMAERYKDLRGDEKLSTVDSPKLHTAIADTVAPALAERWPQLVQNETAMKSVTGGLRRVMDAMQTEGKLDGDVAKQLHGWFGDDAASVMAALHSAVLDKGDTAATERYFNAVNDLADSTRTNFGLADKVKAALPPELQKSATPDMLHQMVSNLRDYMDGTGTENKPKSQVEFESRQIEDALRAHFGDKTDALLDAFKKDAEQRYKAAQADSTGSTVEPDPEQGVNVRDAQDVASDAETVQYHGAGRDKANPQPIKSPDAHRAEFSSAGQAERLIREQQQANPDRVVQFTPLRDLPEDVRAKYPDADPSDGFVTVEGTRDETRMTPEDLQAVRVDTSKTSHAQDNPSRIDTGVHGAVIDARKLVKHMKGKLDYVESDGISARHRTARAFMEGIAAVQDHLGKTFDIPDSTVIAPGFTYGEAKSLSMRKPDPAWMKGKSDEEINAELRRTEALKDMNKRELAQATDKAHDILARREAAYQDHVTELRRGGTKLDKEGLKELRRAFGVDEARSAVASAEREAASREAATRREAALNDEGRTELGTDEQIHRAADANAPDDLVRRTGLDDNPLHKDNFVQRNADGSMPQALRNALDSKIKRLAEMKTADGLRKNMIAAKVAEKARLLFDNFDSLKKVDQAVMLSIVKDKSVASISDLVDGLTARYKDQLKPAAQKVTGDLRTRQALAKIAAELNMGSGDLMAKYDRLRAQYDSEGRSLGAFNRKFAANIKAPLKTVEAIDPLYRQMRLEGGAKKLSAFAERVLGEGDLAPIKEALAKTNDAKAAQRAVDALAGHYDNPRAREIVDAANARITKLIERDPDVAYSMQRTDADATATPQTLGDVQAHIEKVLGKSVDVEFKKMLEAGSFTRDSARTAAGMNEDVIRVSVHALDPMGAAYHESLHAFFQKLRDAGLMQEAHPLMKAADSPFVRARLRALLKDEPDALAQIDKSPEERMAYMYQFWAAGKLELPTKPTTVLGHIAEMFRRVLGIWSNDQRATHIMEYFNSGEYAKNIGDRNAVARALMEGTNAKLEAFKDMIAPLNRLAEATVATGNGRLRATMIPALTELADRVYSPLQGEHDDPGYVPAARAKRGQILNTLADKLGSYSQDTITDALESLHKNVEGATPEERLVMREVRKTLREIHTYMKEAGVDIGDLGEHYFPRVWEPETILKNEKAFRDMLEHYKAKGDFNGNVDQIIAAITRADGSDMQVETVKPGMQYAKSRVLGFVSDLDAAPFLRKNMYDTLNSYITQATRRAEWARRFGDNAQGLHKLLDRAKEEGATQEDLQLASDYLQGVDGTLGDSINPKLRRAYGNMIVYQNVRILPLAIFSSLIDPMGVLVRGGSVGDAWRTMKRGFAEIPKGFKKNAAHDEMTQLAAQLGVIDNAVLMHTIGSSFSQGMTSNFARRVNNAFFKYNLMEQFNTSMRVGATEAALGFLARHADGKASEHSTRWLAELGLKPGEVAVKNGHPLLSAAEFKAHGYNEEAAQRMADRMTLAVNKWVDGAILRPNAAHKPIWMNDPHFALIAHLKQFVYSFQETILKRVANEARHGNVGPAYALAAYVPFMLAADLAKGFIVGGGQQPAQRDGWDAGDYAFYEVQRAGLFGVGQFGVDAIKDVHRGGVGIGALAGPTIDQLTEAVQTVAGPEQFKTFATNAMPANALFDAAENAQTNAVD